MNSEGFKAGLAEMLGGDLSRAAGGQPQKLPVIVGIYFLWKDKAVVYIGQAVNIYARIGQQFYTKDFDSFSYLECPRDSLDAYETALILYWQPPLNKSLPASEGSPFLSKGVVKRAIKPFGDQHKRAARINAFLDYCGIEPCTHFNGVPYYLASEVEEGLQRLISDIASGVRS